MNEIHHIQTIRSKTSLSGTIIIPGDKSISHRSIMLSSLSDSPVQVNNFLFSEDCLSTIACMKELGATIEFTGEQQVTIQGRGFYGLVEPSDVLNAGNSGTTLRLLSGILAAQPFFSVITGDSSLRRRPMGRVVEPLSRMGCRIIGREQSRYAPLAIQPAGVIQGIDYSLPVASAQIKSAILLAALFANSSTTITEPFLSRDHTERMFQLFGVPVERHDLSVTVSPVSSLKAPAVIDVPGDISSAAFWLVAASIVPGSELILRNVGLNPTRSGILDILHLMGADISMMNQRLEEAEPVADIVVRSADLQGVCLDAEIIPRLIDEIPVLAVAALFANGRTVIRGAEELRVKETDRLRAIVDEFGKMGAVIAETADGLIIDGPQKLHSALCLSHGDHRMAMALSIAGVAADGVEIMNPACAAVSYPDFFTVLDQL
ncbi:MAG: 3-phosphoshikimate 1-carboxyvinyltransferase [Negativicutes bacterium]